jgi:hypothetical protein
MTLSKYSFGIGDRFGQEGVAQLRALQMASEQGVQIAPVWNKSNREHIIIGSSPADTRREADDAVRALGWHAPYFVDADHIGLSTVGNFLEASDFFTIDVADFIGVTPPGDAASSFVRAMERFTGDLSVPGIVAPVRVDKSLIEKVARKYLGAVSAAGKVYRRIALERGTDTFVTEISLDEAEEPQGPAELLLILAAISLEGIPIQTIAPKFSGAFLKGVDYIGDAATFAREFEEDIAVIAFAVNSFHLAPDLKLSVHSGSDKFSLYAAMNRVLQKFDAGLHLKTAGTTWLEELIGLAEAGGDGLCTARYIYAESCRRFDELCKPYLSVLSIDRDRLPRVQDVEAWTGAEFAGALRHDQANGSYNRDFRQVLHVGYKVAAEMGPRFMTLLHEHREVVARNVTENLYYRHLMPLYVGSDHNQKRT